MPIQQLDSFMQAIAEQESGGRYDALGPETTTYGRAQGKYQIMEKIWPAWAREAGIPGADPWDPQAQEKVARHKMTQYYQRYGSWDLVAVAWFAGPGRANKAAEQGIESVGGLADVTGTDVAEYVQTLNSNMARGGQREMGGGRTEGTGPTSPMASPTGSGMSADNNFATGGLPEPRDPAQEFTEGRRASTQTMADIFSTVSNLASARDTVVDIPSMFGMDDEAEESEEEVAASG